MTFTKAVLIVPFLSAIAFAQARTWSGASFVSADYEKVIQHESQAYQAKWFWPTPSGAQGGVVVTPFDNAGEIADLGQGVFMLAGTDSISGQGWLTKLSISVSGGVASAVTDSVMVSGSDFTHLVYDDVNSLLYGVDNNGPSLLVAQFSRNNSPPGVWATTATASTCPIIASVPGFSLDMELLPGIGVRISSRSPYYKNPCDVELIGGLWSASLYVGDPIIVPKVWYTGRAPRVAGSEIHYTIRVGGDVGLFGVRHEATQQFVFVGTHSGVSVFESFDVPVSSLIYGDTYRIVGLGSQVALDSVIFRVEQYWDRASSIPQGFLAGDISMRWDYPSVGTDFMSWSLYWDGVTPRPQGVGLFTIILGQWAPFISPTSPVNGVLSGNAAEAVLGRIGHSKRADDQ